jgi:hypothetical protein
VTCERSGDNDQNIKDITTHASLLKEGIPGAVYGELLKLQLIQKKKSPFGEIQKKN